MLWAPRMAILQSKCTASSILHSPSLDPLHCNLHQNYVLIDSGALRTKTQSMAYWLWHSDAFLVPLTSPSTHTVMTRSDSILIFLPRLSRRDWISPRLGFPNCFRRLNGIWIRDFLLENILTCSTAYVTMFWWVEAKFKLSMWSQVRGWHLK